MTDIAPVWFFTLPAVLLLAVSHFAADWLKVLDRQPRSLWLSFAGGVSVAYVFVHILPEIAEAQHHVSEIEGPLPNWLGHEAYLTALAGLLAFYWLDCLVRRAKSSDVMADMKEGSAQKAVFWLHLALFAVYNLIIGFMLTHGDRDDPLSFCLFAVAMAMHFLVNDHGLRQDFGPAWKRVGRWVLVGMLALGWIAGSLVDAPDVLLFALLSFLGGALVLNVLREELPEEPQSRFPAFLGGTLAYSALLLAT